MVFEMLGDNLLTLIKHYEYRGVPVPVVRRIIRQVGVRGPRLLPACLPARLPARLPVCAPSPP
jgi:hypothetical protein